jgi:hypothetical protein
MATAAAERMRRMRARRAQEGEQPIIYTTDDWQLFLDRASLPQKAGCQPDEIGHVILKELVDNALDSGAGSVTLHEYGGGFEAAVEDDGPGLDAADIVELFAVNRPLRSSKKVRRPLRGMLGNGLRVVMAATHAFVGTIHVTSRGRRLELSVDPVTGLTVIKSDKVVPVKPGLAVRVKLAFALFSLSAYEHARAAILLVESGAEFYRGPSLPSWYSPTALAQLIAAAPKGVKPAAVIKDAFDIRDATASGDPEWCRKFLGGHRNGGKVEIGCVGDEAFDGFYRAVSGAAGFDGARIPFVVEAWVEALRIDKDENTRFYTNPYVNGSQSLARLSYFADSTGLRLFGCGIDVKVGGAKRASYTVVLSLITPYLLLTGDGKAPDLRPFQREIERALKDVAGKAYRALERGTGEVKVKDAAYAVMAEAYTKVSANGDGDPLPAKARQIMYAARTKILADTGRTKLGDDYFTQILVPSYQLDNPEETANWDVVYDARGHLVEPHTGEVVALGTLEVRRYLGERPRKTRPTLADGKLYPTRGPENRYRNLLFVEKEGFDELFAAVQLKERFDIAIMSTKGMSVTAARHLIDRLSVHFDRILVLHDFDVSGFSIAGTLTKDTWRHEFESDLSGKVVDIGIRLSDAERLWPQESERDAFSEEIGEKPGKKGLAHYRAKRRETLRRHGATEDEMNFLTPYEVRTPARRIELNAMTSRQLVDFVERKLTENGVEKVMPGEEMIEEQARRLIENKLTRDLLKEQRAEIVRKAARKRLPKDLDVQVKALLAERPELSWDAAIDVVLHGEESDEGEDGAE